MAFGAAIRSRAHAAATAAFGKDDRVYLRPVAHSWLAEAFSVIGLANHGGWPHYELRAPDGSTWIASQLELSVSPLWDGDANNQPRRLRRRKTAEKKSSEGKTSAGKTAQKKARKGKAAGEKTAGPAPAPRVAPAAAAAQAT